MNKKSKSIYIFFAIYLFMFSLNFLAPMAFGDDYLYSFVWQGKPMFIPLTEDAVRISSWHDLLVSQWSHYLTWSGRTVNHTLAQFFLWMGKSVFNYCNALIVILLVAEIHWCIEKGRVGLNFDAPKTWWIFFSLWAFTPGFAPTFLWLDGACNYLWTNTIILGFLIAYIRKYYSFTEKESAGNHDKALLFLFGLIAGWTNENSVCWIVLVLLVFVYYLQKTNNADSWMYSGLTGLIIGYLLLMLAPGNMARFHAEHGPDWFSLKLLTENIHMFFTVTMFQAFLWYFNLRSIYSITQLNLKTANISKEFMLAKVLCFMSFAMSFSMVFSPFFPPRSAFAGTIYLIIAAGTLFNIQKKYDITLIQKGALKFLSCVGVLYFVMTAVVTMNNSYETHLQMQSILNSVKELQVNNDKNTVLTVKPLKKVSKTEDMMSGFHIPGFELSEDEKAWMNVAFARYYGIKGIRMVKEKPEKDDVKETVKTESIPGGSQSR